MDVDDSSPFKVSDPRNHFEHFDERIDDWYLSNPDHNFADANIGPHNFLSSDLIKNLIYGDSFSRIEPQRILILMDELDKQTESSMKIKVLGVYSSTHEASYSKGTLKFTRELV